MFNPLIDDFTVPEVFKATKCVCDVSKDILYNFLVGLEFGFLLALLLVMLGYLLWKKKVLKW